MKRVLGKTNLSKGICVLCIFALLLFCLPYQAFAARSRAGGGDLAKFDTKAFVTSSAITIGSTLLTAGIGNAMKSASTAAQATKSISTMQDTLYYGSFAKDAAATGTSMMSELTLNVPGLTNTASTGSSMMRGLASNASTFSNTVSAAGAVTMNMPTFASAVKVIPIAKVGMSGSTVGHLLSNSSHIVNGFKALNSVNTILPVITRGYTTAFAVSEVGGAIGALGVKNGWKPSQIYLASTIAGAATGSFLNPEVAFGRPVKGVATASYAPAVDINKFSTMAKGAFVGTLEGTAKGLTVYVIDRNRIDKGKGPSVLGQTAGFTAGMMGAGFAREFIAPEPATVGDFYINKNPDFPVVRTDVDEKSIGYQKINAYSMNATAPDLLDLGQPMSQGDYDAKYPDGRFLKIPITDDLLRVIDLTPKPNLFRATFVKPLDNWPTILTQGATAAFTQNLGKKAYLAPLISSATDVILGSVLQNAADIYGLKPSLYLGGKEYVISNRIDYIDTLGKSALSRGMKPYQEKVDRIFEQNKATKTPSEIVSICMREIPGVTLNQDDFMVLDKMDHADQLSDADLFKLFEGGFDPREQSRNEFIKDMRSRVKELTPREAAANLVFSNIYTNMQARMKGKSVEIPLGPVLGNRDDFVNPLWDATSSWLPPEPSISLKARFNAAGTSKSELFMSRSLSDIRSGMLNTAIDGGIQAIFSKNTSHTSASGKIVLSYAANMLSATIRGAALHSNWHKEDSLWSPEFTYRVLEVPKKPEANAQGIIDPQELAAYQEKINNYNANKWQNAFVVGDVLRESGGELIPTTTPVGKLSSGDVLVVKDGEGIYLKFENERPSLSNTMGMSLQRANMQSLVKTWSFGLPTRSENVSTMAYVNYLGNLQDSVGSGMNNAVTQSFVKSNLGITSGNIVDTVATSKRMADTFGLTPLRITGVKNSPKYPFVMQRLYYNSALANANTEIEYPMSLDSLAGGGFSRPQNPDGVGRLFRYEKESLPLAKEGRTILISGTESTDNLMKQYIQSKVSDPEYLITRVGELSEIVEPWDHTKNIPLNKAVVGFTEANGGEGFVEMPFQALNEGLGGSGVKFNIDLERTRQSLNLSIPELNNPYSPSVDITPDQIPDNSLQIKINNDQAVDAPHIDQVMNGNI